MRVAVVGAGIAGLTVARVLGVDHEVVLLERSEGPSALGAGIVLAANAPVWSPSELTSLPQATNSPARPSETREAKFFNTLTWQRLVPNLVRPIPSNAASSTEHSMPPSPSQWRCASELKWFRWVTAHDRRLSRPMGRQRSTSSYRERGFGPLFVRPSSHRSRFGRRAPDAGEVSPLWSSWTKQASTGATAFASAWCPYRRKGPTTTGLGPL